MGHRRVVTRAVLLVAFAMAFSAGCKKAPDDATLTTSIKAQMFSDPQLQDANLQVAAKNGEVTLSGTVPTDAAHLEAYKLASRTPGVRKVNDQISVQAAETPAPAPPAEAQAEPVPAREPSHRARVRRPTPSPSSSELAGSAPPPPPESAVRPAAAPAPLPPPPRPRLVTIAAGTTITIRMIGSIDSSVNHAGEIFHASLDAPLVEGDRVVVPKGADVYVRLTNVSSAGHMSGKSELTLELVKLEFQGRSYPLVSSTFQESGTSRGKRTAATVGGAAALGALLGAIAGGGKGAAIGAAAGGGGGAVYQGVTKGKQVRVPSETKLDFTLEQPLTVTVQPRAPNPAND